MLVQASRNLTTVATVRSASNQGDPLDQSDHAVLSAASVGPDSHAVVFVPGALDLACALIRQGTGEVTIARVGDRHPAAKADVAIVPDAWSGEFLGQVIPCARRMLIPLSTLVIRVRHGLVAELSLSARRQLVSHGFSAIRTWAVDGDLVLRAEMPLCGRLTCA